PVHAFHARLPAAPVLQRGTRRHALAADGARRAAWLAARLGALRALERHVGGGRVSGPGERGRGSGPGEGGRGSGPGEKGRVSGPDERGRVSGPDEKGRVSGPDERGRVSGPGRSDRSAIVVEGVSKLYRRAAPGGQLRTLKSALLDRSLTAGLTPE